MLLLAKLSLTSWWASPPQALPAPHPQTEESWWSCTCSTAVLHQSSTWEHKQLWHNASLRTLHPNYMRKLMTQTIVWQLYFIFGTGLSHWSVTTLIMASQNGEMEWQLSKQNSPWLVWFSAQNNIVSQFQDKLISLCLTNLRLASSEGISHAVTNGVSVITTHHRCRMGSGVCLIATKAPPWSRYSTAYSSLNICRDTKKQSAHSAAACYPFACPTHPRCLNQVSKVILHHKHTHAHTHTAYNVDKLVMIMFHCGV